MCHIAGANLGSTASLGRNDRPGYSGRFRAGLFTEERGEGRGDVRARLPALDSETKVARGVQDCNSRNGHFSKILSEGVAACSMQRRRARPRGWAGRRSVSIVERVRPLASIVEVIRPTAPIAEVIRVPDRVSAC